MTLSNTNITRYLDSCSMPQISHSKPITTVILDEQTKMVFTGGQDKQVKVSCSLSGELETSFTCPGRSGAVSNLDLSFDGNLLLSGAMNGHIKIWSLAKCSNPAKPVYEADLGSPVRQTKFSQDGRGVATLTHGIGKRSPAIVIHIIDAENSSLRVHLSIDLPERCSALAWLPGKSIVIIGSDKGNLYQVDLDAEEVVLENLGSPHKEKITSIINLADEDEVLTTSEDMMAKRLCMQTMRCIQVYQSQTRINAAAVHRGLVLLSGGQDPRFVATSNKQPDFEVYVFDERTGILLEKVDPSPKHIGPVMAIAVNDDHIFTGGVDGVIRIMPFVADARIRAIVEAQNALEQAQKQRGTQGKNLRRKLTRRITRLNY